MTNFHTNLEKQKNKASSSKAATRTKSTMQVESIQKIQRIIIGVISISFVVGMYTFISNRPGANPVLMPSPQLILKTLWKGIEDLSIINSALASFKRVVIGYAIGTLCAILLGTLMGWFRIIEYIIDPIVEAIRPIPPLAYTPLIILWIGIGESSRVLVIILASFLTCIVNAYAGMKQVPNVYVEAAQTLGASKFTVFRTVALPYATPYIFAGMRVAMAASWTTLIAAELIAAQSGLGFILQTGRRYFRTDLVMAGIIVIGIIAFVMDRVFRRIQKRTNRWAEVK